MVELLLAKGANFEHRNVSDYTPLSLAASGGYVNIIKQLLRAGADINSRWVERPQNIVYADSILSWSFKCEIFVERKGRKNMSGWKLIGLSTGTWRPYIYLHVLSLSLHGFGPVNMEASIVLYHSKSAWWHHFWCHLVITKWLVTKWLLVTLNVLLHCLPQDW